MIDLLNEIVRWMSALPPVWMYAIILGIAYGENLVPPVPGDMVVVFGGYLAGVGTLDPFVVTGLATVGGAAGFMSMYALGARFGHALLDPHRLRWLPKGKLIQARAALARRGFLLVGANRFLSGLRSVISLAVGMAHMAPGRTTFWATVSAFVWTALLTGAGYVVGDNWSVVGEYLETYGWVVGGLIAVFVAVQVVYYVRRRRADGAPEDSPPETGSGAAG